MSMNLCFKVKGGAGYINFPFQTPTVLTYEVLQEVDTKKRLELIKKYLGNTPHTARLMCEIKALMANPNLELFIS